MPTDSDATMPDTVRDTYNDLQDSDRLAEVDTPQNSSGGRGAFGDTSAYTNHPTIDARVPSSDASDAVTPGEVANVDEIQIVGVDDGRRDHTGTTGSPDSLDAMIADGTVSAGETV